MRVILFFIFIGANFSVSSQGGLTFSDKSSHFVMGDSGNGNNVDDGEPIFNQSIDCYKVKADGSVDIIIRLRLCSPISTGDEIDFFFTTSTMSEGEFQSYTLDSSDSYQLAGSFLGGNSLYEYIFTIQIPGGKLCLENGGIGEEAHLIDFMGIFKVDGDYLSKVQKYYDFACFNNVIPDEKVTEEPFFIDFTNNLIVEHDGIPSVLEVENLPICCEEFIEARSGDLKIIPNPNSGVFSIKSDNEIRSIKILNSFNQVIESTNYSNPKSRVDFNLNMKHKGFYNVIIEYTNGSRNFSRIILE